VSLDSGFRWFTSADWPVSWVLNMGSLTQEEKEAILWKNLEKLLSI
jgi:hypothetical protein